MSLRKQYSKMRWNYWKTSLPILKINNMKTISTIALVLSIGLLFYATYRILKGFKDDISFIKGDKNK
jgi:hypothetical protein